jgi:8-oxo-dGTP pyrophosphatase MutT (NUDIX family)
MTQDDGAKENELKETVIGTEEIYRGKIVHLQVHTVHLPDGKEAKREVVQHRGAVCIVPITDDGNVLLIRQFRLAAGEALLEIPAGTLEPGETPAACAARELEEETGFRAGTLRPLFSAFLAPGYSSELIHAFLATDLMPGSTHMDEDEKVVLAPMPLVEVQQRILDGELRDAKTIASILVAAQLMNRA